MVERLVGGDKQLYHTYECSGYDNGIHLVHMLSEIQLCITGEMMRTGNSVPSDENVFKNLKYANESELSLNKLKF